MPHPLQRGAVVMRGRRYSVVWDVSESGLVLLPVIRPRRPWAYDVPLDLPDLVACGGVPIVGAVVRPRRNSPIPRADHQVVGAVPGTTMCRVVHALLRGDAEAATHRRWQGHLDARRGEDGRLADSAVNLVA